MGPQIRRNPYHVGLIRARLTRNIAVLAPDLYDELVVAFDEKIPLSSGESCLILLLLVVIPFRMAGIFSTRDIHEHCMSN